MKNATKKMLVCASFLSVVLVSAGCSQELEPKKCSYCGGDIYYHQLEGGGMSSRYRQQFESEGDRDFHKWCYKFKEQVAQAN